MGEGVASLQCQSTLILHREPNKVIGDEMGDTKHNVAKICGNYSAMNALCELKASNENTLQNSKVT